MKNIIKISKFEREIPRSYAEGMLVPGIIYTDDEIFAGIVDDGSISQVINAAMLPGIVKASIAMPDMHYGYGLPIGGVVATDAQNGVIVPGGVGFDINCGVRLLTTGLENRDLKSKVQRLVDELHRKVPAGVGEYPQPIDS